MCRKKPIARSGRRRRSACGTSARWKSWTQTRAPGGCEPRDRLGEALVHLLVDLPRLTREVHSVDEVVEERPQGLVADPAVEGLLLGVRDEDGLAAELPGEPGGLALVFLRNGKPGPPDPYAVLPRSLKRRDKPPRALLDLEAVVADRERERKTVARDHEIREPRLRGLEAHAPLLPRPRRR